MLGAEFAQEDFEKTGYQGSSLQKWAPERLPKVMGGAGRRVCARRLREDRLSRQ